MACYHAFMKRLALVIALASVACKKSEPADRTAAPASPSPSCAKAKPEGPLAWIADDYPAALACAKQRKVPIVVDLWAPWCHTCLSMQRFVSPGDLGLPPPRSRRGRRP